VGYGLLYRSTVDVMLCSQSRIVASSAIYKAKGNGLAVTCYAGTVDDYRYCSAHFNIDAIDGESQTNAPAVLSQKRALVSIAEEAG